MIDRRAILKGTAAVAAAAALPIENQLVGDAGRFYSHTRTIKWNFTYDSAMWIRASIIEIVEQESIG